MQFWSIHYDHWESLQEDDYELEERTAASQDTKYTIICNMQQRHNMHVNAKSAELVSENKKDIGKVGNEGAEKLVLVGE